MLNTGYSVLLAVQWASTYNSPAINSHMQIMRPNSCQVRHTIECVYTHVCGCDTIGLVIAIFENKNIISSIPTTSAVFVAWPAGRTGRTWIMHRMWERDMVRAGQRLSATGVRNEPLTSSVGVAPLGWVPI